MHQEDITLLNIYAPSHGTSKYIKQFLPEIKGETDQNAIVVVGVEDVNTPLSEMDRSFKQKINKTITSLKDTLDQLDIIDIYRDFHPPQKKLLIHSSLVHMEHSQELTTYRNTEIA